jgi:hypothetical protein
MKYRDVITFFISIFFILSLIYTLGVDSSIWYIPIILFVILLIVFYKLWIED